LCSAKYDLGVFREIEQIKQPGLEFAEYGTSFLSIIIYPDDHTGGPVRLHPATWKARKHNVM
jgi:hypothetical protein